MRIIAGSARGRRLQTLPGEATRPTLERVKEGMFSAVQFWLPGARVLDLFAGCGQLGLEALSRGAAHCTFVERDAAAAALTRQNAESAGLAARTSVVHAGAQAFLAVGQKVFDLILLDPPYQSDFLPAGLAAVARVCAAGAEVLCESPAGAPFPEEAAGLVKKKEYRYGAVKVVRYRCAGKTDEGQ